MKRILNWTFYYYGATVFLLGSVALSVLLGAPSWQADYPLLRQTLHATAWPFLFAGLILLILPMLDSRREGGNSLHRDGRLLDTGAYSIVRHPQYVGWTLLYPAQFFFNPQWQLALTGAVGIVLVVLLARHEDEGLLKKFGVAYERYMDSVPGMNLLAGVRQQRERELQG